MEDIEDTLYFDDHALPNVFSSDAGRIFSDYEGNEYIAEGRDKSNNDSSHTVHAEIP